MKNRNTVTGLPNALLRLKGRWDARRGESVVDAYVEKLRRRQAGIEHGIIEAAEKQLRPLRVAAARTLEAFARLQSKLAEQPAMSGGERDADVRRDRRLREERETARAQLEKTALALQELEQQLRSGDAALSQRIGQTRDRMREKLCVYLMGVRSGRLPHYEAADAEDDHALQDYHAQHAALDRALTAAVIKAYEKKEDGNDAV